jgi:hypothetical protein
MAGFGVCSAGTAQLAAAAALYIAVYGSRRVDSGFVWLQSV